MEQGIMKQGTMEHEIMEQGIMEHGKIEQEIIEQYQLWMKRAVLDNDLKKELIEMADEEEKIRDAFYKNLTFGTGGLRGILGAGTDRMNIYTVAKASQGLADYLMKHFESPSVVIGYDSRIKSDLFAKTAAGVFSANGIKIGRAHV